MSRIAPVDLKQPPEHAAEFLGAVKAQLGGVPNFYRVIAHSPAASGAYANMLGALEQGQLDPALRERIAIAIATRNECDYCLAAHALGGKMAGLSAEEIASARRFEASSTKDAAALAFVAAAMDEIGGITDAKLDAARSAGWSDGELIEMIAHIALNQMTNTINRLAETVIDMPKYEEE